MYRSPPTALLALGALLAAGLAGAADAQSMSSSSSRFNSGVSMSASELNSAVAVNTHDLTGNRVIVDGMIQDGSQNSVFSRTTGVGSASAGTGGVATAIGNSLNVVTEGSHNTVIVNARQVNTGNIYAGTTLNGRVTLVPDQ
ncbi:MAG: holdfast anchoring protein HfaA [Caulobacteraceae bacterium]